MSKKQKQENLEHQFMNEEQQNKGEQQNQAEEQNNEQAQAKEGQQEEATSEEQNTGGTDAGEEKQGQATSKEQSSQETEVVKKHEYDELYEKQIRLYSEFENFRKRTQKEKAEMKKEAQSELIGDLLPVLDDFERGLNSLKSDENVNEEALQGIELIYNKFKAILQEKGLEEMEVLKQPFDPEYHEAVTKIEAPTEDQKGKVVDLIQKGYIMEGKIVRHAKVVVGE